MHVLTPPVNLGKSEPHPQLLHTLFEAQAAQTPMAVAVIWEGERLTYTALNKAADQTAQRLRAQGVGPGTLVGAALASSPIQLIALLGILKAGAAYLPLDLDYPAERLAFMLRDSRTQLIVSHTSLRARLPQGSWDILCLDDLEENVSEEDQLQTITLPDDLAYVIYTSGSTGRPKGVAISHASVVANLRWRQETFPLTQPDRLLQTYSFSFDPSVWAFFWPLSAGAAVVLPQPGGIADSRYLAEMMHRENITVMGAGPAVWNALLSEMTVRRCQSLRHAFSGGEALPGKVRRRFLELFPQAALHNVYGPTETTIDATWWTCPQPDTDEIATPIGFPLPTASAWVLDENRQPLLDGHAGELYIGGVGLAQGYLFQPELTQERFVPHPFDPTPGARLYRTGDLARRRPDGALEYLGRLDDQVKLRGYRIELGEIEAALLHFPGVSAAAVIVREEAEDDRRLSAFLVSTSEIDRSALRERLRELLPGHMIPSAFVFLDGLPLTPHGKVDRAALEHWTLAPEPQPASALARTPLETALCDLWAEVLGLPTVGIQDDFFEFGGHSLTATLLRRRIEQLCDRQIPLYVLYEHATVAALASYLQEQPSENTAIWLRIHSLGPQRPFFFLHGDFQDSGFYCLNLARRLGPDQPFYALAPHGLHGDVLPATLEDMAADYIHWIRSVQPSGPYQIGGYCNGGLVAYEIARQLRAAGEDVPILWLIEVEVLQSRFKQALRGLAETTGPVLRLDSEARRNLYLRQQERLMPLALALKDSHNRGKSLWKRVRTGKSEQRPTADAPLQRVAPRILPDLPYEHLRRHTQYVLRPYDGPVTLLRAEEHLAEHVIPPATDWQMMTPQARIVTVPGDHFTCLTEHVDALAGTLAAELALTQGN